MRIFIADTSEAFSSALSLQLSTRHAVDTCTACEDLIRRITDFKPDILVLDLMMPGMDGLTLLNVLHFAGIKPQVLATSAYVTDYIACELEQLSVKYILRKPCTVCAAMSQLNSLIQFCRGAEKDPDTLYEWDALLLPMSFRMNLSGYSCLREALEHVRHTGSQLMTKEVYPAVARICGGTANRVEKAIRDAITDAWNHRDERVWRAYFAPDRNGRIECPTNASFIVRMASAFCRYKKIC